MKFLTTVIQQRGLVLLMAVMMSVVSSMEGANVALLCNSTITNPQLLSPNSTYTMTGCVSDTMVTTLFVELTTSSGVATFENVTINVVEGTMLPRLRLQGASLTTIRNVVIHVSDVFAPGRVANATLDSSGSSVPVTVLDISGTAPTVQNISVTFTNVTLSIVVTAAATYHQNNLPPANFTPVLAAPLLYLVGNAGYINSITNINVCVRNSNLSLVVNTFGTTNGTAPNIVAMCVIAFTTTGVVQGVSIAVLNKSSLFLNVSIQDPLGGSLDTLSYQNVDPALFYMRCIGFRSGR